jgi:hypothetical protein
MIRPANTVSRMPIDFHTCSRHISLLRHKSKPIESDNTVTARPLYRETGRSLFSHLKSALRGSLL